LKSTLLQQQIALSILRTSGNKKLKTLLDTHDNLENFFSGNTAHDSSNSTRYRFATKQKRAEAMSLAEDYLHFFKDDSIEVLFYKEDNYPQRLLECHDAPVNLFKQGNFNLNTGRVVSIVGTRNITSYGKAICEHLIESFKDKNILVISGLAYGVDVYVHELCIKHGIPTVGVLGHGFHVMYPASHRPISKKMQENGGLISEFLPGTRADKIHFPMRNRIIAGLADATIVVESGTKGGSLITADMANGYNRDVFAFPGTIFDEYSKGCNQLIKQNKAHLINSGAEFLEYMNWNNNSAHKSVETEQIALFDPSTSLTGHEKEIFQFIKKQANVPKDELLFHFQHLSNELFGILLQLEMNDLIVFLPAGTYKCKSY